MSVIDENMLPQIDSWEHHYDVLKEIRDYSADVIALNRSDGFIRSHGGNLHNKKTTRGWKLEVEWKDETVSWILLKDIKASNSVETSEY